MGTLKTGALKERLSNILNFDLSKECSSVAYAIMVDGKILAEDSMGKNPLRGGTYNIGSVSKVYCAVAVMQLVEKGMLELDKPVCEYLPKFTMPDERYKQITLRHCLNHSCGLPGTQWRWLAAGIPRTDFHYYEEVYRFLSHSALHSSPGEFSVYCNDGFTLAEMVIAEITGISYGEYCKKYITEPIGAYSSRQSSQRNPDYTHTFIVGMPEESIGPEGAGGIGTTMLDLCKFGELFLKDNSVISETIKKEINKPQGVTFLPQDGWSTNYGLGWDSVDMPHEEYSLGCGVLDKGGGTKEFSSRLLVIPKYNAVLAISATYDCGVDVKEEILQLFATAMLEKGISIWKNYQPIEKETKEKYSGLYISSGSLLRVKIDGARADIVAEDSRGGTRKQYSNLPHKDGKLVWKPNYCFLFAEHDGKRYLMTEVHKKQFALGVNASDCECKPLSCLWEARIGKEYIINTIFYDDIIGSSELNGFKLNKISEVPNMLIASFSFDERSEKRPYFEVPLSPYVNDHLSDNLACGAVKIPYHGGRDLMNLFFEEKNAIEYCECSGYVYRDVSSLEKYCGQGFEDSEFNQVYVLEEGIKELPIIPEGRRILLFNTGLCVVYDSLLKDEFKPLEKGFISFI